MWWEGKGEEIYRRNGISLATIGRQGRQLFPHQRLTKDKEEMVEVEEQCDWRRRWRSVQVWKEERRDTKS